MRAPRASLLALLLAGAAMTAPLNAATLDLGGASASRTDLELNGVPYDIVQNGALDLTLGSNLTFAGILQDGGVAGNVFSIRKLGLGSLTLTGANTYSGLTDITTGTLIAGAANTLSANSRVRIGSTLELGGFSQTVRGFFQSGDLRNSSGGNAVLTTNNEVGVLSSFAGTIVETAGNSIALVKQGAGEQSLIGASNYSGGTTIAAGVLGFGLSSSLGTGTVEITGAGGTIQALGVGLTLANNVVLTANGVIAAAGHNPIFTGAISGAGSLTKTGPGSLSITNISNSYTGGTLLQGGTLLLGGDNVLGDVTKAVVVGPASGIGTTGVNALLTNNIVANAQLTLIAPNAAVLDLAGVISGAGNVVVQGSTGTVILRNANSYSGSTTLNGGILGIGNALSLGGADQQLLVGGDATLRAFNSLTITNNIRLAGTAPGAALTVDTNGFNLVLADTVNNATGTLTGGLIKVGAGTLTLGALNNYSGGTTLRGGTLSVANNNRLGNVIGGLAFDGGALQVTGTLFTTTSRPVSLLSTGTIEIVEAAGVFTLGDPITGPGGLTKSGAGTLVLGTANSFGGNVSLTGGTLALDDDGALSTGSLTTSAATTLRFGTTPLALTFANAITLNGATSFATGGTTVVSDLVAGTATTNGSTAVLNGAIGGSGSLLLSAISDITLNGNNSFAGGISMVGGSIVRIGNANALGTGTVSLAGTLLNDSDGALVLTNVVSLVSGAIGGSSDLTLTAVTGAGSLTKVGPDTLTLSGDSDYAGVTQVVGGTLRLDGNLTATSGLQIASTGTLAGTGTILATVTSNDGAITPGTDGTAGLLLPQNLVLSDNTKLSFDLATPGMVGGVNDLIVVNSNLTLDGKLTIKALPGFTTGTYRLFNYGAELTNNILDIVAVPIGFTTSNFTIDTSTANQVNLILALGSTVYWDGADVAGDNNVDGGNGDWNATKLNWTDATGAVNGAWTSSTGFFQGTAGTVSVQDALTFDALRFVTTGYVVADGGGSLAPSATGEIETMADVTTTINAPLTGANGLRKTGTGTLVLGGTNSIVGLFSVDAGTVGVASNQALGLGAVALANGTTLQARLAGVTLGNAITTTGIATIDAGPGTLTLAGTIGGGGSVVSTGTGNLVLAANNSFNGLSINAGTVTVGTNTAAGAGGIALAGGTTLAAGASGLALANAITTLGGGRVDSGPGVFTLNGTIGGPGSISQIGSGNLVLNGANSFVNLGINAGTVTLGTNTAAGSGGIALNNNAILAAGVSGLVVANSIETTGSGRVNSGPGVFTLNGSIGGAGSISQIGSGNLVLNGNNSFVNLGINTGTVTLSANTAAGSGGIALNNNAILAAGVTGLALANNIETTGDGRVNSGPGVFTLNGNIGGAGTLSQIGTGNLVLNGNNSFVNLGINVGTVTVGTNTAAGIGDIAINTNAILAAGANGLVLANSIFTTGSGRVNSGPGVFTLNGQIAGAGSISQIGSGNLVLNGANLFTNLGINTGTVTLGTNTAAGVGSIALNGGAILAAGVSGLVVANSIETTGSGRINSGPGVFTLSGPIGGAGSISQIGSGNLVLDGNNSFTNLGVNAGTVTLGTSTAAGIGSIALNGGAILAAGVSGLVVANSIETTGSGRINSGPGVFTLSGPISGAGSISQIGSGNLVLNGANSFTNLGINAGTVTLGTNTAAGVGFIALNGGAILAAGVSGLVISNGIVTTGNGRVDSGPGVLTLAASVAGAGSISQIGSGNLVLYGNNSFVNLGINAGTVTLGTNTAAGSGDIALNNGATLAAGVSGLTVANAVFTTGAGTIDSGSGMFTLSKGIAGAGGIAKTGAGTLTLTGASSYTGATTVATGTLNVAGSLGNTATTIASGATLMGNGSIAGAVTIANGGILSAGAPIGTLTLGALTLNPTSVVNFALGQPNVVGGAFNDLTVVTGNLTLDGLLNVTNSNMFGRGIYELFSYGGALTDNGLTIASLPGTSTGSVQTLVPGQVNLVVTAPGTLMQFWDGADGVGNGVISGGSGTWNTVNTNWTGAPPSLLNANWQGGIAVFQAPSGTITINETQSFVGLQFATTGYTLNAGTGGLATDAGGSFAFTATGATATINAPISGSGGLAKQGGGTLVLNGANSFAGGTDIQTGNLVVGSNTAAGTGTVTIANLAILTAGTSGLRLANAVTTAGAGRVDAGPGVFTLAGPIGGPGSISHIGSGNLVLNGNNSFVNLGINRGTVTLGSNTAAGTGFIALNDQAILAAGVSGLTVANIVETTGSGRINSGAGVFTLNGPIGGAGSISQVGTGNLVLNGNNSFTNLGINQGRVTVGTNTAAGIGGIAINEGGILAAGVSGLVLTNGIVTTGGGRVDSGAGVFTLNGGIGGAGSISQIGTGNLVLNGNNSFVNLGINQGRVTVGTNTAAGVGGIAINEGGILAAGVSGLVLSNTIETTGGGRIDSGAGVFTLNGPIGGAGSISQIGTGNLVLNGTNSFVNLGINQGRVTIGNNSAVGIGSIAINEGGILAAGVSGLTLGNLIITTGGGRIDSGAGVFTLAGPIAGAGSISQIGTGNLVLNGNNSFVNLGINQGRVTVGTNTAAGSGSIAINQGGILAAGVSGLTIGNLIITTGSGRIDSGAGVLTINGVIAGAGSISQIGTGNLVLNGNNSFVNLGINQGTVTVGTNTAAGAGLLAINQGAILAAGVSGLVLANNIETTGGGRVNSGAGVFTLNGTIVGAGSISQIGTGNLVLNGTNSFVNLGINQGTVTLGSNTAAGAGSIAINNNATLAAGVTGLTIANGIETTGAGRIDSGTGMFTLNGAIGGAGSIAKLGIGNLVLNANNSYTGGTAVNAGRLTVGGTILGPVTVASGATLAGTGTVGSFTAASGSTVSPGATAGAAGTLSVNGSATLAAGSTFAVDIIGSTNDRLVVSGAANIAGANLLLTPSGSPLFGQTFTLLTAAGGRTGTFATTSFTQFGQAFNPTVIYNPNDVMLRLAPSSIVTLQGNGGTPNTNAIAGALDAAVAGGFNPQNFFPLFTQSGAALTASLNQLTGEIGSANARTALADTRHVREAAFDRLNTVARSGDGTTASTDGERTTTLWARGIGSWTDTDGDGNGAALDIEAKGVIAGVDFGFGDFKAGAMFNYIHSDVDTDVLGEGKVESTGGGVYAGYRAAGGFAVGIGGAISSVKSEQSRSITVPGLSQTLRGNADGTSYQLFGEVAFDLAATDNVRIEPFARIAYAQYKMQGYSEAGGFAALTYAKQKYDATFASVGLRGSTMLGETASLRGSVGYQRASGDRSPVSSVALQGTTSFANIRGVALDKDSFIGEAGVDFRIGGSASLGVGYSGVIGKNNKDNGVKATLTVGF